MSIKGIIFDMDGVIVDNHRFHVAAWEEFMRSRNRSLTEEEFSKYFNGRTTAQALGYLFPDLSTEQLLAFKEEKESLYRSLFLPNLKETDGLTQFLKKLKEEGYQIAVATAAYPPNVAFTLDNLGIRDYFDAILDESFVTHGKPHPEVYDKTIQSLGVEPQECVVFEDSFAGIAAGKAAGAKVIGVVGTETQEALGEVADSTILNFVNFDFSLLKNE